MMRPAGFAGGRRARQLHRAPDGIAGRSVPLVLIVLGGLAVLATIASPPAWGQAGPASSAVSPVRAPAGSLPAFLDGGASGQAEFLHPDQAFVASAAALDARTVRARWDIAPGHYLYRDKLELTATLAGAEVPIVGVDLPPGAIHEDAYFGTVETYRGVLEAVVHLGVAIAPSQPLALHVTYQGCADAGLCYPPIDKELPVALAGIGDGARSSTPSTPAANATIAAEAGTAAAPGGPPGDGLLGETDRIARTLAGRDLALIIGAFYLFGLLLSLTPCVLPMVPILSSLIVGTGGGAGSAGAKLRSRSLALTTVYVGAMAVTYAAAGVLAGLTGANLQVFFQHPAVLIVFVLVFVALAASMFGLYELQLPSAWQSALSRASARRRGGTYAGAGALGVFSALIVGPCVAAPLAGALIYISQTGDAVLGGVALLFLALGMGTPVLLIGASAGALLPRVGPWMAAVQRVFGFVLLGVAVYLLERLLPGWLALALWAVLLMVGAIYMGALDALDAGATGWRRLRKGTGLAVLVYGILLMVGAAAGGDDVFNPLGRLAAGGDRTRLEFRDVKGIAGLDAALDDSRRRGRAVVLDYYADWCVSCKELERHTFRDPAVREVLAGAELLRTDVTRNDAEDRALLARFGLFGPPAILFFGADGTERPRYRVIGYMDAQRFRAHAAAALAGAGALTASPPGDAPLVLR